MPSFPEILATNTKPIHKGHYYTSRITTYDDNSEIFSMKGLCDDVKNHILKQNNAKLLYDNTKKILFCYRDDVLIAKIKASGDDFFDRNLDAGAMAPSPSFYSTYRSKKNDFDLCFSSLENNEKQSSVNQKPQKKPIDYLLTFFNLVDNLTKTNMDIRNRVRCGGGF